MYVHVGLQYLLLKRTIKALSRNTDSWMIQSPWCACEWIQSNLSSLEMDTFFLLFHSYRCLPLLQYMSISAINWFTREGKHVTICHKLVYQRENRIVAPLLHLLPKYNSYGQHQSTVNNKTTSHLHTQNFSLKKWNKLCNTAADDKWNKKNQQNMMCRWIGRMMV